MDGKTVLIVDDEQEILESMGKKLSSEGYKVVTANSGKDGVGKARNYSPNLILMDILMPDMDGAEVVAELKDNEKTQNIPIVFISGIVTKENENAQASTVKVGERRFDALSKPFSPEELLSKVKESVR